MVLMLSSGTSRSGPLSLLFRYGTVSPGTGMARNMHREWRVVKRRDSGREDLMLGRGDRV